MTRSLPNVPLWPRPSRVGTSFAIASSSSRTEPAGGGAAGGGAVGAPARGPNPTGGWSATPPIRAAVSGGLPGRADARRLELGGGGLQRAHPLEAGEELALAVVEPLVDVEREHVPAARGPDAERDGDGVLRLVRDRDRDAAHPELLGPPGGAAPQDDRGLARREPLDLDVRPADAAHAEAQHLRHGLLRGPSSGEGLGPHPDVPLLSLGEDPVGEAGAEAVDRRRDPLDLDDVDAQLGRPLGNQTGGRL